MTQTIQIRLTRDESRKIKENSQIQGFNSHSAYLRHKGLVQDFDTQDKIREIHNKIIEIHDYLLGSKTNKKFKKNQSHISVQY